MCSVSVDFAVLCVFTEAALQFTALTSNAAEQKVVVMRKQQYESRLSQILRGIRLTHR